jgi:hypothetical protein
MPQLLRFVQQQEEHWLLQMPAAQLPAARLS